MRVAPVSLRLALAAVVLSGLCGWKFTLDGPLQRTRQRLELRHRAVELYRQMHGGLPTPTQAVEFMETLADDPVWRGIRASDGWGRSMWICRHGDTIILLSWGPNGLYDGGGVDDLSIEIE